MDGLEASPEFSHLGIGPLRFEEWSEPFLNPAPLEYLLLPTVEDVSWSDIAGSSTQMSVVHLESTRTVRTLLGLSNASATNLEFECEFEGIKSHLIAPF